MKTRHLLATAACMAAMALAATGCSKDELTDATGNTATGDNTFSFTASTPAPKPATRLEYTEGNNAGPLVVKWASGEEAFFALNAGSTATWKGIKGVKASTDAASKTATFVAKDTDGTNASTCEAGSFYALYPAKDALRNSFANISTSRTYYIYLQLNGQTGKLADMHNFDYMTAEATITGSSTEAPDLAFSHRISVLRLSGLTFSGLNGGSATNISISGTGLKTKANLVMTGSATPTVQFNNSSDAILTTTGTFTIGSDGKLTENVYICFFPPEEGISNLRITATVGETNYGYSYSGTVGTSANPFEEGNMYTLSDAAMESVILYDYDWEQQESEVGTKPTLQTAEQANSENNPYLITTREELQWLKTNPTETYYYKLMKDVELTNQSYWHPIGNNVNPFEGHFDGNNKKIMGSMKSNPSTAYFGFFGYGENAHIKNLHMKASIDRSGTSRATTGGIIGNISGGNIEHCTNAANIKNSNGGETGGIAGAINQARITACTNTGSISLSANSRVGGICGGSYNNGSSIAGCINKGTVSFSGTSGYSGGIVGDARQTTVTACWNNATEITGGDGTTGAIVGKNAGSNTFNACYWKHQEGLAGINGSSTTSSTGTFTDAAPTTEQISMMNTKWKTEDSERKYQFNATTGEIEPKP